MFCGNYPWKWLLPEHAKRKRQASVRDCTKSARRRFRTQDVSYLERHINHSATWDLQLYGTLSTLVVWKTNTFFLPEQKPDTTAQLEKSSSSPRAASVFLCPFVCLSVIYEKTLNFCVGIKIRVSTWSFLSVVHPLQIPIPMYEKKVWVQQENL